MIFIIGYSFLAFNIENQGRHVDEGIHVGYGMIYFDHTVNGDILHPCITGLGQCNEVCDKCDWPNHWLANGGFVKGMMVGFGDYLFNENERQYYAACHPDICSAVKRTHEAEIGVSAPTQPELAAARFTAPIIGALTSVLAFSIGKNLFNRFIGLTFSIVLLFHSLWFIYSRTVMSESYVSFFMILSLFLLVLSLNVKDKIRMPCFILSAIIFAIAINTKLPIIQVLPFFMTWIFLRQPFNGKLNFGVLKNKKYVLKSFALVGLFSGIIFVSVITTSPYYYPDPVGQIKQQYDGMIAYRAASTPWQESINIYLAFLETFSVTIIPTIDTYYYLMQPNNIPLSATYGHTFTSIPLSLFFIIGSIYLIFNIVKKKLSFAEFLIIIWFFSSYLIISMIIESYNSTRYFIPLIFPMISIAAYGLWRFIQNINWVKPKIVFLALFIVSHISTVTAFWQDLYFEPSIVWVIPVALNLKYSLANPIVLSLGIIFLVFSLIIGIKKVQMRRITNP